MWTGDINSADLLFVGRFTMYCRKYTGTVSCVLCREVCCTACMHVSLFGSVHHSVLETSLTPHEIIIRMILYHYKIKMA